MLFAIGFWTFARAVFRWGRISGATVWEPREGHPIFSPPRTVFRHHELSRKYSILVSRPGIEPGTP